MNPNIVICILYRNIYKMDDGSWLILKNFGVLFFIYKWNNTS